MKEETKKTIKWIKDILKAYKNYATDNNVIGLDEYIIKYHKAVNFLDSLPEIESHLCRGGYIQDKNRTPCCHGDTVTFQSCSESKKIREGQLWWFKKEGTFFIRDKLADWRLKEIKWFEKVKK